MEGRGRREEQNTRITNERRRSLFGAGGAPKAKGRKIFSLFWVWRELAEKDFSAGKRSFTMFPFLDG